MSYYRKHLTELEKKIFDNAKQTFEELLDDLNSKKLLRTGTPHDQRERLSKMWRQSRLFGIALNTTLNVFLNSKKTMEFVKRNEKDGFNLQIITDILLNQYIGNFIYNIETVFRTSLNFFLKEDGGFRKRMELGPLLKCIKEQSPTIGQKVDELIDKELRNSIAHGAIWFESQKTGGTVCLTENSHLENSVDMPLSDFMIRMKKQNIISHAFIEILMEKADEGYFLN